MAQLYFHSNKRASKRFSFSPACAPKKVNTTVRHKNKKPLLVEQWACYGESNGRAPLKLSLMIPSL